MKLCKEHKPLNGVHVSKFVQIRLRIFSVQVGLIKMWGKNVKVTHVDRWRKTDNFRAFRSLSCDISDTF